MAYNQNGAQYPYSNQQRQQHPPVPPHQSYPQPQQQQTSTNPTPLPYRQASTHQADRQNAEMFIPQNQQAQRHRLPSINTNPQPQAPQPPSHATYNPSHYTPISPTYQMQPQWPPASPMVARPPGQLSLSTGYPPANYAPPTPVRVQVASYSNHAAQQGQQTSAGARNPSSYPRVNTNFSPQYGLAAPPPLPVIPSAGESPAEDWGQVPSSGVNRYASTRYANNSASSHHSRNSSSFSAASVQMSPSAPPPPPHAGHRHANSDLSSRPLPRLPPGVSPGEDDDEDEGDQSIVQQSLENSILASVGARANGHTESDSDAEALAGVEAMREAERQDLIRRASGHSTLFSATSQSSNSRPPYPEDESDDMTTVDLSGLGGGWDAHMSYGGSPDTLTVDRHPSNSSYTLTVDRHPSTSSYNDASPSQGSWHERHRSNASEQEGYNYATGGLADPSISARRLSFDEGDENQLLGENAAAGYEFYHPGITNRPLPPPPPPGAEALRHTQSSSAIPQNWRPTAQFDRGQSYNGGPLRPDRHTSLVHPAPPSQNQPARAVTDADDRKRTKRASSQYTESRQDPISTPNVSLDVPGVGKRFNPAKLTVYDFNRCTEPWSLRSLGYWLKTLVKDDEYLKKPILIEGLVQLFIYKVRTMNIADAEMLAAQAIDDMLASQTLYVEEEWVQFSEIESFGVLVQMTGAGCYAPRAHTHEISGKCYSYKCQRDEKKIALSHEADTHLQEDWQQYWKLTTEQCSTPDKKEIARQNNLHELVQKEEKFLSELAILQTVYRDGLAAENPPILSANQLPYFMEEVFGKVDAVRKVNEEHLVPQIKYRQKEQGPFVGGFSSIYREWIRRAKNAYIDYANAFPNAIYKMKLERERNAMLYGFLDRCQKDPRSRRLDFTHYLKVPITHIQQVILLLATILKCSKVENEEKRLLEKAIDEIKKVTQELDARVAAQEGKVALTQLQAKLKYRPEIPKVNLNLDHLGRELIYQGPLQRASQTKLNLLDMQAILLDNYLVLARISNKTEGSKDLSETYDVTKIPIPIELLVLESSDDDPVTVTAIGGVVRIVAIQNPGLNKIGSKEMSPTGLQHTQSVTSIASMQSNKTATPIITNVPDQNSDKQILYPFKVKHLGTETYTLYAFNSGSRAEWCENIIKAQTHYARTLMKQNSEPFKLRVLADTAFGYDSNTLAAPSIPIKGTPLYRAVRELEAGYGNLPKPGPICRAKVNCSTSFMRQNGQQMLAVGTDFGVYVSAADDARGWNKVIPNRNVTQIAVLEDFQLFLLISEKSLVAYHLDIVCPPGGVGPPSNDLASSAPQKLSGNRDVGFFATGRMKDRTLVFYKKRDGISSSFKVITVLEPVLVKSTEKKSRFPPFRSGKTDFFRDFDEFYIATECLGMNIFNTSIAVSTTRGIEILNLDRKQPTSIPYDLDKPHSQTLRDVLASQKPLGMFRISDVEFLLAYENVAVYVDKQGDVSRSKIMEYVGKAQKAALYGPYLVLFDSDFVEIRNATNGRLRQIIAGRDVRCLDDGVNGGGAATNTAPRTIKVAMMHPEIEKCQIVVELLLREGMTD